jgi:glycosyltransferase involved in cell wall biosynthesis
MDLSIMIPARNEMFLAKTVEDILSNIEGDTEVIVILDGEWADPPIEDHPKVTIIHHSQSIGQRAATNEAVRLSTAKYVMKVDAHCAFDKGFDVKMMKEMQDNWTMIPVMRNLHAFDWVCPEGHRRYQGPSGKCTVCGKETKRDVVWIAKTNPQSTAYYFDKDLHFQYHGEYKRKQVGDIVETMSAQGSCFMLTKERYQALDICDQTWGSWGNQGTEVALKTWLSGGRLVVNRKTWYAHMFRTQGGDFSFPWPISGRDVEHARQCSRDIFLNDKWDKAVRPLHWLIEKFNPPTWATVEKSAATVAVASESEAIDPTVAVTKGLIYYTDNQCDELIATAVRKQIKTCCNGHQLVSVSLKPVPDFGENIVLPLERSRLTMFKQILTALESSKSDVIFFCEADVLYHPSHFDFTPTRKDIFYYNDNKWKVDANSGQALFYHCAQVSGLCAYRELLLDHYRKRVEIVEKNGYDHNMGYEPGTHTKQFELWNSEVPNIDIRHGHNLTKNRWSQDQFRNKNSCLGWTMADEVPGWGITKGRMNEILTGIK